MMTMTMVTKEVVNSVEGLVDNDVDEGGGGGGDDDGGGGWDDGFDLTWTCAHILNIYF